MILNYRSIQISVLIAIAAVSTFAQTAAKSPCLNYIGQKEWAVLLSELEPGKKKMLEDDAARADQVRNMKRLLAFGCEATKLRLDAVEPHASELGFIRSETFAGELDRKRTKLKPGAPFSWITDAQVTAFYKKPTSAAAFQRFFATKTELLNMSAPPGSQRRPTIDDAEAAKDFYAKMKIAETAAAVGLTPAERSATELKARLQQAQFLSRIAAEELSPQMMVSDAEVAEYIARHPEFDDKVARDKAAKLRDRARAGEDFAALANEFSEDPGNDGASGKKNGGLYADVPKGMMVPVFENAALSLRPGEVSDVVQSDFGFHVIKLERKSADGSRYDVRHILIATGYKDPKDPSGRTVPVAVYVRTKLEDVREAQIIESVVARNPVTVEDIKFPVAAPTRPAPTRTVKTTVPAKRKR